MLARFTCLLLLVLAWRAPQARAQADESQRTALARSLFEEGLQLAHADAWPQAAERFRRALALKESAVLSYNLAVALGKLGQVVEASELLLRVLRDPQAREDIKRGAQLELDGVQPRIAKLRIVVHGELASSTVRLDARVLDAAALGVPIPVDPGEHVVVLGDAETTLQRVEVSLLEAGEQQVELEAPQRARAAHLPTPSEAAHTLTTSQPAGPIASGRMDSDSDSGATAWESPWLWVGVGGAAAAVTALVVALSGGSAAGSSPPVRGNLGSGTIVVGGQR